MLSAIAKFFKRVAMWLFSPNYHMRVVDGKPRIVRTVSQQYDSRKPFLVPDFDISKKTGKRRVLVLIKTMPSDPSWRYHRTVSTKNGAIGHAELIGKLEGEWCMIESYCTQILVTDEVLATSYFPALVRLAADAWTQLDTLSIEMIMKCIIIDRWKKMADNELSTIIQTFDYRMEVDKNGVEGLYAPIDGVVVIEHGQALFAPRATKQYFESLIPREEYVIEAVHKGAPISYTISDCPTDWYVHHIDHVTGEITYVSKAVAGIRSYTKRALPGSYVHAMGAEQRKAVLSEWEIPKADVVELQRAANASAAELIDPVPVVLDDGDTNYDAFDADEDDYNEFDELDGPVTEHAVDDLSSEVLKVNASSMYLDGKTGWDSLPKHDTTMYHATELREWKFVVEIDDYPLGSEIAYIIPAQYNKDGPIEALVAFKAKGGVTSIIAPKHYPVVEMTPVKNIIACGDGYKPQEIVVTSRGWRYMFRDEHVPGNCVLSEERLVRNNPTGKPLITFEYVYEEGPFVGKIAMRRFVVPSQVLRVGANNKRKAGKRRPGIGKRR